ncbi:heparan-alpha-glucosaminide N-acetyltransferase domain-containing protein [Agromyces sp. MMS24-K17]|uniref:heparan-alpha-glucosaminide N-acetyltransferase domain-containing protein n=1 Tax=Agromyces sp. MMS24-K17 TaxID=3372850 RepID=UPI003754D9C1
MSAGDRLLPDGGEPGRRIEGVDLARGLALIGMFLAHVAPAAGEPVGALLLSFADERPRLLFALTAGLALGFISGGTRPIPAAPGFAGGPDRARLRLQVAIRAGILIALGLLITAYLRPLVFVILDVYGIAFLLLLPLLFLPRRVLLWIGVPLLAVAPGIAVVVASTQWVADVRAAGWKLPVDWAFSGAYPVIEWVPVMLIGLALARYGADRPRVVATTAIVGGAAAALLLGPAKLLIDLGARQLTDQAAHDSGIRLSALGESLHALANVGVGCLVVATAVALTALAAPAVRRIASAVASPVTAMGAMPFTIYTVHLVVLAASIRVEDGLLTDDSWALAIGLVLGSMAFAWTWRRYLGRGPLETIMRWASLRAVPARVPLPPGDRGDGAGA